MYLYKIKIAIVKIVSIAYTINTLHVSNSKTYNIYYFTYITCNAYDINVLFIYYYLT